MSSGPNLFVVCKNCQSEVSPYITECPYCGHRLRKRAPKIEREGAEAKPKRPRRAKVRKPPMPAFALDETRRPYATLVLLAISLFFILLVSIVEQDRLGIISSLDTDPWRVVTSPFVYSNTWYELVALLVIGIYGWRLELRHGPLAVIALFLVGGVGGMALVAELDPTPFAYGGNGIALALLCAWVVPDLLRQRAGEDHEGDLLGTLVLAALLLLMPLADTEISVIAGCTGAVAGLLTGALLSAVRSR